MNALETANMLIMAGELTEALAQLDAHLLAHPDDDEGRRMRIALLRRLPADAAGDPLAQALADLARLTTLTVDDWVEKAIILEARGDLPGAAAALGSALNLRPFAPELVERRLDLLMRLKRLTEALNLLDGMILARRSAAWRWRGWRGDILMRQRQPERAIDEFTQAIDELSAWADQPALIVNMRAQMHLKRAAARAQAGQFGPAHDDYAAAEALVPGDPTITFARGLMLYALGEPERGRAVCAAALADAAPALRESMRTMLAEHPRWSDLGTALGL